MVEVVHVTRDTDLILCREYVHISTVKLWACGSRRMVVPPMTACGCQGFQLLCICVGYGQVDGPRQDLMAATPFGLKRIQRSANGSVELLSRIQQ